MTDDMDDARRKFNAFIDVVSAANNRGGEHSGDLTTALIESFVSLFRIEDDDHCGGSQVDAKDMIVVTAAVALSFAADVAEATGRPLGEVIAAQRMRGV